MAEVAAASGLSEGQVSRIYSQIEAKRAATQYLQLPPLLTEPVNEIAAYTPLAFR